MYLFLLLIIHNSGKTKNLVHSHLISGKFKILQQNLPANLASVIGVHTKEVGGLSQWPLRVSIYACVCQYFMSTPRKRQSTSLNCPCSIYSAFSTEGLDRKFSSSKLSLLQIEIFRYYLMRLKTFNAFDPILNSALISMIGS